MQASSACARISQFTPQAGNESEAADGRSWTSWSWARTEVVKARARQNSVRNEALSEKGQDPEVPEVPDGMSAVETGEECAACARQ